MRSLFNIALLVALTTQAENAWCQPPTGSHLPLEKNSCATCHGEKELWGGDNLRLYIPADQLANDIHWKNGVNCHDCHGGDPSSFNVQLAHASEVAEADQSQSSPFRPDLGRQARTAKKLAAVIEVCGKCHQKASDSYLVSVHGHGLQKSGLVVVAVCTDCHGSHNIEPATSPGSMLHSTHVGTTCAKCHRFIQERLQKSVHGQAVESPTSTADEAARAPETKRKPSCIDCHQGHDLPYPKSGAFRLGQPDHCGSCHADLSNSYAISLHGQLTELGNVPAAKCSDCHGAHDILPLADPSSRLSAVNRRATCAKCHPNANKSFLDFDPHANPANQRRDAVLYWVNAVLTGLLTTVFVVFGLHSFLWFVRSLVHVAKEGRPGRLTAGKRAYLRFRPVHRIAHAVLMTSFLGLALTGLPLKYSDYEWAHYISTSLGGFSSTSLWHKIFGIANLCCLGFYILWFGGQLIIGPRTSIGRLRYIFGPDSPVPNRRDPSDFARMLRWFVGLGPKPTFERWTYWEKFDLWAASADIVLIGTTGLILWFPNEFCRFLPGQTLNIASLIHGKLALLATGFVFAIHFLSTNLRPEKFPMDISIFTGLVSQEEMQEERPDLVERLRESGRLEEYLVNTPSRHTLLLAMLVGAIALSIGLALLIGIVVALF